MDTGQRPRSGHYRHPPTQPATIVSGLVQGSYEFRLTATDDDGDSANDTVSVTVNGAGNTPPTAQDFAVSVDEDSNNNSIDLGPRINDNDTGDTLTTIISTAPVNGTATITNNVISYTPTAGYDGADSIGYTVSDGNGGTATATISITVTAGNTPPTAQSFAISVDEDSNNNSIDLGPRINDSDPGIC